MSLEELYLFCSIISEMMQRFTISLRNETDFPYDNFRFVVPLKRFAAFCESKSDKE